MCVPLRVQDIYLLGVGVHEVSGVVSGDLQGVSLAGLLLRRLDRHARAKVDPTVRRFVLGLHRVETKTNRPHSRLTAYLVRVAWYTM